MYKELQLQTETGTFLSGFRALSHPGRISLSLFNFFRDVLTGENSIRKCMCAEVQERHISHILMLTSLYISWFVYYMKILLFLSEISQILIS